jgi:tripartite-type tricarboxylate transporter receptor subunit TctC
MRRIIGALAALAASTVLAFAHDFPSRPITMIIGFPPGGPTDALARILADGMKNTLGQAVVVETVSGAAGTIAAGRVVHADPDGYTIGIGNWSSHVGAPALYALDYDSVKDLQPISLLAASPLWILGKASLPPNTAAELISWVKSTTAPATFGTVGTGSAAQLCGIYFQQKTAANLQFVPYRGAGPAIQDLLAGQIDLACLEATSTLPYVTAGKMKAFAILNEQRWPPSPNTPTMIESGVPGLSISFWHALWTTKGTPKPVVARLVAAVQAALADPAIRQHLEQLGQVIFPREQQNPEALAAYHKAEIDKWWPIIKAADIKTE